MVVIVRSCGVRSGTYLSRSARLDECVPMTQPALARAMSGISRGQPSIVLLTSTRPLVSITHTLMSLNPPSFAASSAALAIASAASSVSIGFPGASASTGALAGGAT